MSIFRVCSLFAGGVNLGDDYSSVFFFNDLETDEMYEDWPKTVKQFMRPVYVVRGDASVVMRRASFPVSTHARSYHLICLPFSHALYVVRDAGTRPPILW